MENQKSNKAVITLLIIIIVILSTLCVLFATDTIILNSNKVNNNEVTNNNTATDVENNNNGTNIKGWVNYLKNKNIIVKTSAWDSTKDVCEFNTVYIDSEDINKIIDKLSTTKITKYYYGSFPPVGTVCSDRFILEYENHKIRLEADGYIWIDDDLLSNKIDLDVDITNYADNYTEDSYVYKFDANFADIFNQYINN